MLSRRTAIFFIGAAAYTSLCLGDIARAVPMGRVSTVLSPSTGQTNPTGTGAAPPEAQPMQRAAITLGRQAAALAAMQALQAQARAAAGSGANNLGSDPNHAGQQLPNVPDGLNTGGLTPTGSTTTTGSGGQSVQLTPILINNSTSSQVSLNSGGTINLPTGTGNDAVTISGTGFVTTSNGVTPFSGTVTESLPAGSSVTLTGKGTIGYASGSDAAIAITVPSTVTNFSTSGVNVSNWSGIGGISQSTSSSSTPAVVVTVDQTQQQALLNWTSFNIGKNTTLDFDQSAGGANVSQWVAVNRVTDPSGVPSQILGQMTGLGQIYVINQNGIIFGGSSQVNTGALVASSLPINTNLLSLGLLDNPDEQFLFSQLTVPAGLTTPAFTPPASFLASGQDGDVTVQAGAQLTSPATSVNTGGKIALIGPNVSNAGTISTPNGQTILAAGLQVGLAAHPSTDPSLRGLDVYVGQVTDPSAANPNYAGTATNSGLIGTIDASGAIVPTPAMDVTMAGMNVNQLGVIDGSTSVTLNSRIDLLADYNTVSLVNGLNGFLGVTGFYPTSTGGTVTLGEGSLTQVVPDSTSTATVVGTQLALPSLIDIQGQTITLAASGANASDGALIYAPGAVLPTGSNVDVPVSLGGAALAAGVSLDAGGWASLNGVFSFLNTDGNVTLGSGAIIDVSGSENVNASVQENIIAAQLLGSELANSPLQQDGALRGATVYIDVGQSGVYDGQSWVGSPIGDLSGYVGLVERTVGELTAAGGTVAINSGGAVDLQAGSTVNVSGGWINYQGGLVQTTKVISNGQILDISQATPNLVYSGILGGYTTTETKYGLSQTYTSPLVNQSQYEAGYVQGGNGGALAISSPSMNLNANLYGNTVTGTRQRSTAAALAASFGGTNAGNTFLPSLILIEGLPQNSALSLAFQGIDPTTQQLSSPTPPNIDFGHAVNPGDLVLPTQLVSDDGFGSLTINDSLGNLTLPTDTPLITLPGGSITITAANIDIESEVDAPGGSLSFTALEHSPYDFSQVPATITPPPVGSPADFVSASGNFTLGAGGSLLTTGLTVDDRAGSATTGTSPLVTSGGAIVIDGYSVFLNAGSQVDASGGVHLSPTGVATFGNAGSISIAAGQDPESSYLLGGQLLLEGSLSAYSGNVGGGGSLTIQAPLVQIGGATLQNGDNAANIMQEGSGIFGNGNTLWLDKAGSPDFFSQGGFENFTIDGLGEAAPGGGLNFLPGVLIASGPTIAPIVQSFALTGDGTTLTPLTLAQEEQLLPSQRTAVNLAFAALGVKNTAPQATTPLLVRGDLVMQAGASFQTDPQANSAHGVSLKAQGTATVLGKIWAPGGTIAISGSNDSTGLLFPDTSDPLPTVDLGPSSYLSTAGVVEYTPNGLGFTTGSVLDGGTIQISGNIVAETGSVLDVSGASAILDESPGAVTGSTSGLFSSPMVATRVDSNGGSIVLTGGQELYTDATLIGKAGGASAEGGSLSVSSGYFSGVQSGAVQTALDATLVVTQNGPTFQDGGVVLGDPITAAHPLTDASGDLINGYFAASENLFAQAGQASTSGGNNQVAGGFGAITLGGTVKFSGPVTISADRSIVVGQGNSEVSGGVIYADAPVVLNAPHVTLGQPFQGPLTVLEKEQDPIFTLGPSGPTLPVNPTFGAGSLTVNADTLIDVGNLSLQNIGQLALNAAGAGTSGEIRGDGTLDVAGTVNLTANQIYPTTETDFTINAYDYNGTAGNGTVTIARPAGSTALPALPLSGGGVLSIYASNIFQGGVLRAPIGTINLGSGTNLTAIDPLTGAAVPTTQQVVLTPGSVTSVSAVDPTTGQALVIPYGIVNASGDWIDPAGNDITTAGNIDGGVPSKAINISGTSVTDQSGATLDIQGGGDLYAYQFVSGVGGTNDILASLGSFAVIPSYSGVLPYAPYAANTNLQTNGVADAGYANSHLAVGQQVYLNASNGLPAGIYTLLPARYALLPGAFLITPESGVPGNTVAQPNGASLVSGHRLNGADAGQTVTPLSTVFQVESQAVVRATAQYNDFLADTYFSTTVASQNATIPRLPVDAGQLVLAADSLALPTTAGSLLSSPGAGGLGSEVDIASPEAINIDNASDPGTAVAGALNLDSAQLSAFGADSLLIGGYRSNGSASTTLATSGSSAVVVPPTGGTITFPQGTPGNDQVRISGTGTVGTLISPTGTTPLTGGEIITVPAGGSIALTNGGTVTFASGSGGSIPVTLSVANTGVTVTTNALTVNNAGETLRGPDIILVSNQNLTVAAGSSISGAVAAGAASPAAQSLSLVGNGALLRVSSDAKAQIVRTSVHASTGTDPASLQVAVGATAGQATTLSGGSVILDSTNKSSLDSSVDLSGTSVALDSGQISVELTTPTVAPSTQGLILSGQALTNLQANAQALSLLSYSSIDIYNSDLSTPGVIGGEATAGVFPVTSLALHASDIRGFGGGDDVINAQTITLDNSAGGATLGAAPGITSLAGSFTLNAQTIILGSNALQVDQFAQVNLNATKAILLEGLGVTGQTDATPIAAGFATAGNLALTSPVITGASSNAAVGTATTSVDESIRAGGSLTVAASAPPATSAADTSDLGASLVLAGASVVDNGNIVLHSGSVALDATGTATGSDVAMGGTIDVSGRAPIYSGVAEYTSGGRVTLSSAQGQVMQTGLINVSALSGVGTADSQVGNGGSLTISAPNGIYTLGGVLEGQGSTISQSTGGQILAQGSNGNFSLDVATIPGGSVQALDSALDDAGFTQTVSIRDRTDANVSVDGVKNRAASYTLSADKGSITVNGTIDASNVAALDPNGKAILIGGTINLDAGDSVVLASGSTLTAAAQNFSNAGQGGSITLQAGASTNGSAPSTASGRDGSGNFAAGVAVVDVQAGSVIDLSVAANNAGSAVNGDLTGTLVLEAPQTIGAADIQIDPLLGTIHNASSIAVEGLNVQNANQTGIVSLDGSTSAGGAAGMGTTSGVAGFNYIAAAQANAAVFMSGAGGNNWQVMQNTLLGADPQGLSGVFHVRPAEEIDNTKGGLVLNNTLDLSTWRYGPQLKDAQGNPLYLAVGSPGSVPIYSTDPSSGAAAFAEPGSLVLRAAGNLNVSFGASISDGFDAGDTAFAHSSNPLWSAPLLPAGTQSWSYQLIAGADTAAASANQLLSMAALNAANLGGSFLLGVNSPTLPASLTTQQNNRTFILATDNFFETIRTGTGDIDIQAGNNAEILNPLATIYTAGTVAPTLSGFTQPALGTAVEAPNYGAQYSYEGGNVVISAQNNIGHFTNSGLADSSKELPTSWLDRQGTSTKSTSWWIDFSNFFEGVGALGGGNVSLNAGGSVVNIDAVVPTNARQPGVKTPLLELGGGNLAVHAGDNIDGGVYYVESGQGSLDAGQDIVTNSTRAAVTVAADATDPTTWLPTTLFLGDGSFDVVAGSSLTLGPVANPFLLPQGTNNGIGEKSYFSTYASTDAVDVSSLTGTVTLKDEASGSSAGGVGSLAAWYNNVFIAPRGQSVAMASQPWLRVVETSISPFTTATALMPPTLRAAAYSGDIDLVGSLTLSPSATGTVDLVAEGALNGFQINSESSAINVWDSSYINLSDANPALLPSPESPLFSTTPQTDQTLASINALFAETGATQGVSLQTKSELHADIQNAPLHADDLNPIVLDAETGNISGVSLFSGKAADITAGQDITDIALYIQNDNADDISVVSAGRDITAYDATSSLRVAAQAPGNQFDGENSDAIGSGAGAPRAGDIQISGPGALEVLAGRNLSLGVGPSDTSGPNGSSNGTNTGITSVGSQRNPALSPTGASVIAAAGLGGSAAFDNAAQVDFGDVSFLNGTVVENDSIDPNDPNNTTPFAKTFAGEFLSPDTAATESARYLPDLGALMNLPDGTSTQQIWTAYSKLPVDQQRAYALDVFYLVLRDAGRDHNTSALPGAATYAAGFQAIQALFPANNYQGDISLTSREIKTESGGDINILAPGGQLLVGFNLGTAQPVDQGILTQDGGNISIFTQGDVTVGTSRIFTLHGGNEIIWSSAGDIAAGASSRTLQSAPPTRVLIDATSGAVETDLAGLATGGGIGVLETVADAPPADIDLIAPVGTVDAGDAGIRVSGNLNIAAVQVLNAGHISVGGASSGVPTVSTPNLGGLAAASSAAGAGANAGNDVARQQQQQAQTNPGDNIPSLISVEVIGYGGGDG